MSNIRKCIVPACSLNLNQSGQYNQRVRVCARCMRADRVLINDLWCRWEWQLARFLPLEDQGPFPDQDAEAHEEQAAPAPQAHPPQQEDAQEAQPAEAQVRRLGTQSLHAVSDRCDL